MKTSRTELLVQQTVKATYCILCNKIAILSKTLTNDEVEHLNTVAILYKNYPRNFSRMLAANSKYNNIVEWIYKKTAFLKDTEDFSYSIPTRLNWIFNGKDAENNICHNKNCSNHCGIKCSLRLNDDFPMHCSRKCSTSNIETVKKQKQTKLKHYNNENYVNPEKAKKTIEQRLKENPNFWIDREQKTKQTKVKNGHDPNWNNRKKSKKTFAKHIQEDANFRNSITAKAKTTKFKHFGNENFTNPKKAKQTRIARYGKWEPDEAKKKRAETCMQKYNAVTEIGKPEIQKKIQQTFYKKYGTNTPFKSPEVQAKIKKTIISKYGVDHVWKNKDIQTKSAQTKQERYGTPYGHSLRYIYDNMNFDSSWELAIWIYCKDHNISIEHNPCTFVYEYDGKQHLYLVDFRINGKLVEVKGDQFFKEDGTMQNPYNHELDGLYEAKHQCMIENDIAVLKSQDVKKYLDYIFQTYGATYLENFTMSTE